MTYDRSLDMATSQGQDIIRCQLCSNPVEHHCNLCQVDLCLSCIPKHMTDKSRKHEVVEYTSKKEHTVILPSCLTHKKNRCEAYCHNCKIPICIQCLTGSHKKHEFTDINDILQKRKHEIDAHTKELENIIVPKYRNVSSNTNTADFDKVLSAIKEQEDEIRKVVRETSIHLTEEVIRQRTEVTRMNKESQSLAKKVEKEVNQIIKKNKDILTGNDATAIINYQSRNEDFQKGPELSSFSCPKLLPGIIKKDQIVDMFGFLQNGAYLEKKPGMLKMMDDPVVLSTIQSPYGNKHGLWRVQCIGKNKILICGEEKSIKELDRTGSILRTIPTNDNVRALTINLHKEPVFSSCFWHSKDVHIFTNNEVKVLFGIPDWYPVGLCYTANGDLLVSMRSMDRAQSKVVRYTGTTVIQKIQYDRLRQPLFSTGVPIVLLLTENGNGDICVADNAGKAVVVVDSSGGLRFRYQGNLSKQSKYREFKPSNIAADVKTQILINDISNNIVHIIDCDGNFVRYIAHPCNGGLNIDTDHNLVIGGKDSGIIKIIKYLE